MKKVFILLVLFLFSCGYNINLKKGREIKLQPIDVRFSGLPGLAAELDNRIVYNFQKLGYNLTGNCPVVSITLLSSTGDNYFFTKKGTVSKLKGRAVYSVKIKHCDNKITKRKYNIPMEYSFYGEPYNTQSSQREGLILSIDKLIDEISESLK